MTTETKWISVYKTINKFEAEVIKGNIEHEGIPCVLVNKQDSSYLTLLPGMVELRVPEESIALAHMIIQKQTKEEQE